jgi:hypothetical protein
VMRHRKNSAVTNMVAAVTGAGAATEEATDHRASAGCGLQQQLQTAKTALHPPQADRRRSTSLCAQQLKADCQVYIDRVPWTIYKPYASGNLCPLLPARAEQRGGDHQEGRGDASVGTASHPAMLQKRQVSINL